jgi:serine/threonine protein kinase/Tol biopolymer transport system component
MGLTPGTKLGPYEIISPLGAGGMGEVYRARDTRLDRDVAIKILPQHLSSDPDLRARFEREAKAISGFQHPHICTLHDIGSHEGVSYLVMEMLEGESLASRLERGPLPLKDLLRHGAEIADALDKAHRQGIIHRDLKPGNIMLTKSGAKLLDFGLAKPSGFANTQSATAPSFSAVATMTSPVSPITQQGKIVGTVQYMSPEQIEGKEADRRSDIFAFGCVLYEMATGKRAFEGKSNLSVASAILEKEPEPISKIQPLAPPGLEHIVQRAIAKDPEERWQSASDIRAELKWVGSASSQTQLAPLSRKRKLPSWAMIAAVLVIAALAGTIGYQMRTPPQVPVLKTMILPPEKTVFSIQGDIAGPAVISRDGARIAFVARSAGPAAVWVRSMDSLTAVKLEGTEGASFPFWSWDGKDVGYFTGDKLMRIPANGGAPIMVTNAANGRGASWGPDDTILFASGVQTPISRVKASGGTPTAITTLDKAQHTTHRWPVWLPDGKHFLYYATSHGSGDPNRFGIYYATLDGKMNRLLVATDGAGDYASGYLLFHNQVGLVAQHFDPGSGTLSGEPLKVVERVQHDRGVWHSVFSVSQNGVIVFHEGVAGATRTRLVWYDRAGKAIGQLGEDSYNSPRISPDGRRIGLMIGDPSPDLWTIDIATGVRNRLTFKQSANALGSAPAWSPDGRWLARAISAGAAKSVNGIEICDAAGGQGGTRRIVAETGTASLNPQWTPDGKQLLFLRQTANGIGIYTVSADGNGPPIKILEPPNGASVQLIRLSPNGKWLAYVSNETGQVEVYITDFPNARSKWQVTTNLGHYPVWRGDGKELFFLTNSDLAVHSIPVKETADGIELGKTERLFEQHLTGFGEPYDVTADGKRFLGIEIPSEQSSPLIVNSNWLAEVQK